MSYQIKTSKEFDKFLERHRDLAPKVVRSFRIIAQNPRQNALDIAKLKGEENKYRLRLGKYRFLYEIIEEQILVYAYKANSRGDVYR